MALNLGDIRFGLTADVAALQRAQAVLRSFAQEVNSVVTKTDNMGKKLQSAAAQQEKSLRSALMQLQQFSAAVTKAGGSPALIRESELAYKRLAGVMQAGQLNALDFARANDRFSMSMLKVKQALASQVETQKAALAAQKEADKAAKIAAAEQAQIAKAAAKAAAEQTRAYNAAAAGVDRLKLAMGGSEAATVRMQRAQLALDDAVQRGIIDTEEAVRLQTAYAESLVRTKQAGGGILGTLMNIREELGGLRKIAFTMNSLVASFFFLTQGLKATVGASAEFSAQMAKIQGLTNATAQQTANWSAQILKLSPKLATGPKALAEALYFIASSGVPLQHAMQVLVASTKASAAGLGEVKDIANLVTSVLNVYGYANISAAKATGILIAAVKEGKAEPAEFASAIGRVLGIAKVLNVPFKDIAAAIATFTRQGYNAQEAATLLENLLRNIVKPSSQAQKALSGLYYQGQQLSAGWLQQQLASKGLLPTLIELSTAAHGNSQAMAEVVKNDRALRALLGLMTNDAATAKEVFTALGQAGSSDLDKAFGIQSQQAMFHFKQALAALQAEVIEVAATALPAFVAAADFVTNHIHGLFQTIGALASLLIGYFSGKALVGVINLLISATSAVRTFAAAIAEAGSLTAAFGAEGLAASLGGIVTSLGGMIPLLGAVIGLVVALGYAFRSATDTSATDLHSKIQTTISAMSEASGGPAASLKALLDQNQKNIQDLQNRIADQQAQMQVNSTPAVRGAMQADVAGVSAANAARNIEALQKQLKQATTDSEALKEAIQKVDDALRLPGTSGKEGGVTGVGSKESIVTLNNAVAAYQQYIDKVRQKTLIVQGATKATQDGGAAEAYFKAAQEADAIATKLSLGNLKLKTEIMKQLTPYINDAAKANEALIQAQADKKGTEALQRMLDKYHQIRSITDEEAAKQEAYNEAVQKLREAGVQSLDKFKSKLEEVRTAAGQAFEWNKYSQIFKSGVSNMQSALANFFESPTQTGISGLVHNFATAIKQMIAEALALKAMLALGSELDSLQTGLGQLLGFEAPMQASTIMSTAMITSGTTVASTMATAIMTAGEVAASSMAAAITAAGMGNSVTTAFAANGMAFSNGVRMFANGGLVNAPTMFTYQGNVGMMGEAGTEAIMPITSVGGRLGVDASGVQGDNHFHMNYNVNAQGADAHTIMLVSQMIKDSAARTKADIFSILHRRRVPRT